MESSTIILEEKATDFSLEGTDVIDQLRKITLRNTSKDYEKIKSQFINKTNSYVVKQGDKNIFRFSILGDYEYVEYHGVYYKYAK